MLLEHDDIREDIRRLVLPAAPLPAGRRIRPLSPDRRKLSTCATGPFAALVVDQKPPFLPPSRTMVYNLS